MGEACSQQVCGGSASQQQVQVFQGACPETAVPANRGWALLCTAQPTPQSCIELRYTIGPAAVVSAAAVGCLQVST
jgi:hypothetical protein